MEHNFKWKNNGRTKIMIGCGTRPEIIRLAAVIKRCREYFDCCVVYYNQNWDRNLSTVFWEDFELKNTFGQFGPDILVPVVGENLGVTCGNILGRSYELLSELQPEGYLVLGDTNSCLSAISAKRLHIPLFHMEAGNRCKDECLPEETNRRIVDVISDVNLCYSEFARKYLADTGLPKERTYMTGSPMAEVLHMNLDKIRKSDVLERLGLEKGTGGSRHAPAPPPGVYTGRDCQPLRLFRGQLPLPGVQKRNRPLPRAVAGYGRSVPPPRPLPGGEPARAGALHLNQFFLSGSAVSRARFFAVYILSSASFTASLIFLRTVSNSVQPTDTRGRMGIPARQCP